MQVVPLLARHAPIYPRLKSLISAWEEIFAERGKLLTAQEQEARSPVREQAGQARRTLSDLQNFVLKLKRQAAVSGTQLIEEIVRIGESPTRRRAAFNNLRCLLQNQHPQIRRRLHFCVQSADCFSSSVGASTGK